MNKTYNQHRLEHNLVRLIVELEFDSEIYYMVTVNGILHNHNHHSEWKEFIVKQKQRGELYVVPLYPKVI